jgi:hypothetical protein
VIVTINATCPSAKRVVGGGYLSRLVAGDNTGGNSSFLIVFSSGPNASNSGWQVAARSNNDNSTFGVTAYAICATVSP